jgi:hypothetical protein
MPLADDQNQRLGTVPKDAINHSHGDCPHRRAKLHLYQVGTAEPFHAAGVQNIGREGKYFL